MTIASKLFYCRRTSTSSRSSEQELDRVNADRDRRLRRDRRSSPSRARQLVHPRSARTDKSLVLFFYQLVDNGDADISDHPRAEVSNMSKCNHWKTATASDQLNSGDPAAEIIFQAEQVSSSSDINKKPCVLGHRLKDELFVNTEGEGIPKGLLECSICLEKFSEGEGVIRLPCRHMYHHACLEPWMQAHQLCPYCRASVVG
ncbi:hypothetical protein B296_00054483 [Ensete ventricosum]|uniref:RING-type domain-containing protein n=1 Tax=Ensete ventricosum TaxID=4639 RepID=A0A426XMK2_ENSVE|nr:hypothetical protein B296_00054483 [Ensete ventricosum]